MRWNINLVAETTPFFDDEGRRTRVAQHITEDNTVQNTGTGLTPRDGPVNFVQTTYFDPETQLRELITIAGTSVNVRRHPPLAKHRARGSGPLPRAELQRLRTRTGIPRGVRR